MSAMPEPDVAPAPAGQSPAGQSWEPEAFAKLQKSARDHLWMHFTRMSGYASADVPVIVRGEGPYVWDARGRRYLDALGGTLRQPTGSRPARTRRGRRQAGR